MEKQEYLYRLTMIQKQSEELEEKMQQIDKQIQDMGSIRKSIEELDGKEEILSNLGKGIFLRTGIKEEDLFVNVGKNILIRKTQKQTIEIIGEQIAKLLNGKKEVMDAIEELHEETNILISEVEREKARKSK